MRLLGLDHEGKFKPFEGALPCCLPVCYECTCRNTGMCKYVLAARSRRLPTRYLLELDHGGNLNPSKAALLCPDPTTLRVTLHCLCTSSCWYHHTRSPAQYENTAQPVREHSSWYEQSNNADIAM